VAATTAALLLFAACAGDAHLGGTGSGADAARTGTFVVVFRDWPSLSVGATDWAGQGAQVVDRLRRTAASAQRGARRAALRAGATWTTAWVADAAVVRGSTDLADDLADRPEVASVRRLSQRATAHDATLQPVDPATVASPTPGVAAVGAPAAWAAGRQGTGMVVGVVDTGVDATHPALAGSVRPTRAWFDAVGGCRDAPCDRVGHGTMAAGVAVGDAGPGRPAVGVAPGATWIAARACDDDGCGVDALLAAAQWMLAPTAPDGSGAEPAARPQVVNNSWGSTGSDAALDRAVEAWRAAGMVAVFAAGNDGPGCGTVTDPGDRPDVLAVGATNDLGQPLELSGRGARPPARPEPELSAPGAAVVSTVPGGGYAVADGTSLAAPAVSGGVAVARAALTDPTGPGSAERAVRAVTSSARPSGGPAPCGPGTATGAGLLDLTP
jgi:subtilisin family serine protease